jgi:hypothetical protein
MDRETRFTQSRKVRKVRKENQGLLLRASLHLGGSCFDFFTASKPWVLGIMDRSALSAVASSKPRLVADAAGNAAPI